MLKKIVSFGFMHGVPASEAGAIVIDVRQMFRNPYQNASLRRKTGMDVEVQDEITLKTAGFVSKYAHVKKQVLTPGTEVVYIGCQGGQHRSVFLAERLGNELGVPVEHRDLDELE